MPEAFWLKLEPPKKFIVLVNAGEIVWLYSGETTMYPSASRTSAAALSRAGGTASPTPFPQKWQLLLQLFVIEDEDVHLFPDDLAELHPVSLLRAEYLKRQRLTLFA